MDILLIFYLKPKHASVEVAIQLAKECDCIIENDRYKVIFHENDSMFKRLLTTCGKWTTTELFIDNKEYSPIYALNIITCYSKGQCQGLCQLTVPHGYSNYARLFWLIKKITNQSFYSSNDLSEWEQFKNEVIGLNFIRKIDENTFEINKEMLKNKIIEDYEIPLKFCHFTDQEKIFFQIDQLPEKICPKPKLNNNELIDLDLLDKQKSKGFTTYNKEKYQEIAEIMSPIFAREIKKELIKLLQEIDDASDKIQK